MINTEWGFVFKERIEKKWVVYHLLIKKWGDKTLAFLFDSIFIKIYIYIYFKKKVRQTRGKKIIGLFFFIKK